MIKAAEFILCLLFICIGSCNPVRAAQTEETAKLQLIWGDEALPDEDAFVLLIFGDGFTLEQQEEFFSCAEDAAEYLLAVSPFDEFAGQCKIYAAGTVSRDEGACGEDAGSEAEAREDMRQTFFGSHFWGYGTERLLCLSVEQELYLEALSQELLPAADYNILLVNSEKYGGSGGNVCVTSRHEDSLEILLHELGHTIAGLADEYWPGDGYEEEAPNMTKESDPDKVRWRDYLDEDGIGLYPYEGHEDWYHPSQNCKMGMLGKEYEYCAVCKDALRAAIRNQIQEKEILPSEEEEDRIGSAYGTAKKPEEEQGSGLSAKVRYGFLFAAGLAVGISACLLIRKRKSNG